MSQKHPCPCQSQAVHLHLLCDLPGADHNIDAVVTWAAAGTGASQFSSGELGEWRVEGGKSTRTERGGIVCTMLPSTGKFWERAVRQGLARWPRSLAQDQRPHPPKHQRLH